jgi:hypothetical protein
MALEMPVRAIPGRRIRSLDAFAVANPTDRILDQFPVVRIVIS